MKTNKAFSLIELILVVFISSLIIISCFKFIKELNLSQIENQNLATLKIDLNATKIIIEKNLPEVVNSLKIVDNKLFMKTHLLLQNVTNFSMQKSVKRVKISIELQKKISQTWEFKL